ncbi:hypothetical protein CRUP_027707 [Coryphaenoides rupestris]|nr:hypothetical protein CRUP_027707 [Coryphaenoides rupestris]
MNRRLGVASDSQDPQSWWPLVNPEGVMGLRDFWRSYKVLLVMLPSLALVHVGWYRLQGNPLLRSKPEVGVPEPGIVAYVSAKLTK